MRLLNTETLEVKEFLKDIPIYAILSHTWEQDEVTFRDIQDLQKAKKKAELAVEEARRQVQLSKVERIQGKAGWLKIEKACEFVRKFRFNWIWIDTCCIDKSSSAELSEALNSMYKYYGDGRVCIAYLSDVPNRSVTDLDEFKKSRWFERGWTLQELIAPRFMVFLNQEWNMIGTRFSMRHIVSEVTSIPVNVFENGIVDYSIAQRMSWAASRKTTREEDMAYCLMGLFGVNMPPIYGEGGVKAFMRLQQEIIKHSDDRSIFAWVASQDYQRNRGLFASSPSEFASSGEICASNPENLGPKSSFLFSNNGLHIHLSLQPLLDPLGEDIFFTSLHCQDINGIIGIYLKKYGQHYIRWCPHLPLHRTDKPVGNLEEVIVKESAVLQQWVQSEEISFVFKLGSQLTPLGNDVNLRSAQSLLSVPSYKTPTFRLRTQNANEFDTTLYNAGHSIPVIPMVPKSDGFIEWDDYQLFQDSCLLPIDNENGLASCFVYRTGNSSNQEIVEINYILSSSPEFKLYRQMDELRCTYARSTSLSFTVDFGYALDSFSSTSFYPCGKAYGSVSYPSERDDVHCVFECKSFWFKIPFFNNTGPEYQLGASHTLD